QRAVAVRGARPDDRDQEPTFPVRGEHDPFAGHLVPGIVADAAERLVLAIWVPGGRLAVHVDRAGQDVLPGPSREGPDGALRLLRQVAGQVDDGVPGTAPRHEGLERGEVASVHDEPMDGRRKGLAAAVTAARGHV